MEKQPRILIAAHIKWHNAEAEYVLRLARGLIERGVQVLVWGRKGSPIIEMADAADIPVATAGDPASLVPSKLLATSRFLAEMIGAGGFAVVNAHRSEGYPVIAWTARRAGAAVVRTRADMRPPSFAPVNSYIHNRLTDRVIVANDLLREDLILRLGLPGSKVATVRMGIDPDELTPGPAPEETRIGLGIPPSAPVAAVMGRLGPVKGHEFALRAAKKTLEKIPDARFLVIYRDIELSDKFLPALRKSGIKNSFVFVGPGRDHVAAMRAADVAVIPSVGSEAHCRVALEWMSLAKPVIGSRVGVIPEIVAHGDTGFLVQPRYSDTLAHCMIELLADPDRARAMGEAGRARLIERFTEEYMVDDNLKVFREAMAAAGRTA